MLERNIWLNIRLMGTPEISMRGLPLALNHLKSRALLYYLAATAQSHTRAHLATLLWGESGQTEAYHSLRSSLYHLRKAMQSLHLHEILISDGELLGLEENSYRCDVVEFRHLLATDDERALSESVKLYNGPFLEGFTVTGAPAFDDWIQIENTRLNQACFEALDRLTTSAESRKAWTVALGYAQQMIQIDALAEGAQQRLMRLYLRQGEVGLALRHYRQFENQLLEELGITPSPETRALQEEMLRQQRSPVTRVTASIRLSSRQPNILPFVGRVDLLQTLTEISDRIRSGNGTTVLIQGEGGIGKSRLLEEFASRLINQSPAWLALQGACSPFDDLLSHGPFLEALQNGTTEDFDELLDESNASVPDARGRFFWRVLQMIRSITHRVPLILVIEDLQWANSSTLNLFGFLSMRLHHLPVMLVGTVQHADAIPALQRLITLGRRRRELQLLSLAPLTPEAIQDLLDTSGVNSVSVESLSDWLYEKSGGNPFLLSEILAQLRTESILQPLGKEWHLDPTRWLRWRMKFTLPETTHDLVSWRLADLSPDARMVLDVLAVAAQPVPEVILHHIPGISSGSFPILVNDLVTRGLILELPERGLLALSHHLLRETLLHRLSNLRRRTIHRQLAEALDVPSLTNVGIWLRQVALHAVAGEDVQRARRYGINFLSSLPREYAGAETVDFVQHLHDLLAPTASRDEMVRMTRALGLLHQSLGHLEVAAHWHKQNLIWAEKARNIAAQAEAHFEMSELALMRIDYHTAAQAAQEGLAKIPAADGNDPAVFTQPLIGRGYRLLGARNVSMI